MSTPPPGTPSPGVPISNAPIEPGRSPRGGCARGVAIGCAGAGLLAILCVAAFFAYVRRHPETATDVMMGQVEKRYASDVTSEDKERLRASYQEFRRGLVAKRYGPEPLERVRSILSGSARRQITRDQVLELARVFEEAARGRSGGGASPPATPSPGP